MADSSAEQEIVLKVIANIEQALGQFKGLPSAIDDALSDVAGVTKKHFGIIEGAATDTADHMATEGERAGKGFADGLTLAVAAISGEFLLRLDESLGKLGEYAESVTTLGKITGNSAQQIEQFQYAMVSQGVPIETAGYQLAQLQRRIEEASQKASDTTSIFYQLGISAKDLAGKDSISQMEILADRISNLKSHTEQVAAATELFGRYGAQMLPILTQGAAGVQQFMAAAGTQIPSEVIESLERYHVAMAEFNLDIRNFYASLLAPIVDRLTAMANAAGQFIRSISNIDPINRMLILISALTVSLISLEAGLETVGGFLAGSFIRREAIDAFKDFVGVVSDSAAVLGIFAAVWTTNFGRIQEAAIPVVQAVRNLFANLSGAIDVVRDAVQTNLVPAFQNLQDAVEPVFYDIGQFLASLIDNQDAVNAFSAALVAVVQGMANAANGVADFISWVNDAFGAVNIFRGVLDALVAVSLAGLVDIIFGPVIAALTAMTVYITGTLMPVLTALPVYIVGVFEAIAAGEDLVFPPLIVWQSAFLLIGGAILAVQALWEHFSANWTELCRNCVRALEDLDRGIDNLERGLANIIEKATGLNFLTDAMRKQADQGERGADAAARWADNLERARLAKLGLDNAAANKGSIWESDPGQVGGADVGGWGDAAAKKPPGSATLKTPQPKTNEIAAFLDPFKAKIEDAKQSILDADAALKSLKADYSDLGSVDSPQKVTEAQALLYKQIEEAQVEIGREQNLLTVLGTTAAAVRAKMSATSDVKQHRELQSELNSLVNQEYSAREKIRELQSQQATDAGKYYQEEENYLNSVAKDEFSSWEQRIAAAQTLLTYIQKNSLGHEAEIAALKQLLDIDEKRAKAALDLKNAQTEAQVISLQGQIKDLTAPSPTTKSPAQEADEKRAQVAIQLQIAELKLQEATAAQAVAQEALKTLTDHQITSGQQFITAQTNEQTATNAVTEATQALQKTQVEYNNAVKSAQSGTQQLGQYLQQTVQQLAGPLFSTLQGLVTGYMPQLASGLEGLFQQSYAYTDVQRALTEISKSLAQVFDALRPVIDFLLGALIGITNVFLELYNILVEFLDIFGLGIQKIALLNSDLQNFDQVSHQLIEIGHDLPTINQYNEGMTGNLVGEGSANPNDPFANTNAILQQGFNASISKFGEIIGILGGLALLANILGLLGSTNLGGGVLTAIESLLGLGGGGGYTGPSPSISDSDFSSWDNDVNSYNADLGNLDDTISNAADSADDFDNVLQSQLQPSFENSADSADDFDNTLQTQVSSAFQNTSTYASELAATLQNQVAPTFTGAAASADDFDAVIQGKLTPSFTGAAASADDFDNTLETLNPSLNTSSDNADMAAASFGSYATDADKAGSSSTNFGGTITSLTTDFGKSSTAGTNFSGNLNTLLNDLTNTGSGAGGAGSKVKVFGDSLGNIASQAGEAGAALGIFLGILSAFGVTFGPNPKNEPDINNTQQFGQDIADLQGTSGANGQSFQEDPTVIPTIVSQVLGSSGTLTMLEALQDWITQQDGLGLSAQQIAEFSGYGAGGAGNLVNGKLTTGAASGEEYSAFFADAQQAIAAIAQIAQTLPTSSANINSAQTGGLTTTDGILQLHAGEFISNPTLTAQLSAFLNNPTASVADLFGNSSSVTSAANTGPPVWSPTFQTTIQIDSVVGTDDAALKTTLQPVIEQLMAQTAYKQQAAVANQQFVKGSGAYSF